jgi:hypothetical protein
MSTILGPESPFSTGAKKGEGEQFTRDVFEKNGRRAEINGFTFRRYEALGWIVEREEFPYYALTVAGEKTYDKHYYEVAPKSARGYSGCPFCGCPDHGDCI